MSVILSVNERPRFLSEADCHDIVARLKRFSVGGGYTAISLTSIWKGNIRWARNQINTSSDVKDNHVRVHREINGARAVVSINDTTDAALVAANRRAERLAALDQEQPNSELITSRPLEEVAAPQLFSETTYQLDADRRAAIAVDLTKRARAAGMLSAGYIEVSAIGMGILDTAGRVDYFSFTQARYSVTVRDPNGTASGWAGIDWYDWNKIDTAAITGRALDKCLASRNPVAVEPGRYTTILEPQAVADLVGCMMHNLYPDVMDRSANEGEPHGPFFKSLRTDTSPGFALLGEKIVDERITISADPKDPELGFPPFGFNWSDSRDQFVIPVYHPTTWIDRGVLVNLAYDREQAVVGYGQNTGAPNSESFRMSGGNTPIEEMIATTKRGILVTRFDQVASLSIKSQLYRGYTRDGLWLVENGKISKSIKNFAFTESILFVLNNIDQLGHPQRAFHPRNDEWYDMPQPVIVPPMKVRDFSFTSLADSV